MNSISKLLGIAVLLSTTIATTAEAADQAGVKADQSFSGKVLVSGLEAPWEVTWGPDKHLWVTERMGKRVTRVNAMTGEKKPALTIDEAMTGPQHEGVLGLALHPELLTGDGSNHFVYVAFTYDANEAEGDDQIDRRAKIVRFTYDAKTESLGTPMELIAGLPAGNDHNSGRLKYGPDGRLYYTIGDQGANQFGNFCKHIRSQLLPTKEDVAAKNWSNYSGKLIRLNPDGTIPSDNPAINGVQSHIFSYGFRNAQGIVFGSNGLLYQAEHGPKADDEINLIEGGKNYGWPHVAGFKDDQGYVYGAWGEAPDCDKLTFSDFAFPESVAQYKETSWSSPDFVEPLKTFYTVPNSYNFQDPNCGDMYFICWPTIAPSSIDYYPKDGGVPGWCGSLLVTSLKNGSLYRLPLTGDGRSVQGDAFQVFDTVNRYRDAAISGDGKTIYIATDSGGIARDDKGGVTDKLANPGAILQFTYEGQ